MIFLLISPDEPEKEYAFESNSGITIGRSLSCDIVISCKFISRIHCTLVLMCNDSEFYYLLFDGEILGNPSKNGTWVNENRIVVKHHVKNRDVITFCENVQYPRLIALSDDIVDEKNTCEKE